MMLYDMTLYRVFWQTRRLFQRLSAEFQPVPGGAPLAAAQRAVLEFLDRGGPQSVPDIARQRSVSRQHIQVSVNALVERGWAEARPNPAHRRSPLIALTSAGRERLGGAQAVERKIIAKMAEHFDEEDLAVTARTLAALDGFFATAAWAAIRKQFLDKGDQR